jgi:membrane protein DedA with SNARE-associated domain
MQEWIVAILDQFGYAGVFLLILIENVFPPIPSEVILSFCGFMTTTSNMSVFLVVVYSTLGSVFGAILLYKIGSKLNNQSIRQIINKYGKILRLKLRDVDKTMDYYKKYQRKTVFFGRMIPMIRSLISIPAGMSKMNMLSFIILTAAGSAIWNTLLVNAGAFLGNSWKDIAKYISTYSVVIWTIIISVSLIALIYKRIIKNSNIK